MRFGPSTEVDEGVDVYFLVGWGCAVISCSRPYRLPEAGLGWRAALTERHHGTGHP
jgi:hypothetical protein